MLKGRTKSGFVNDKLEAENQKPTGRTAMRQGYFSWVRVCAGMLAALLEASAAQAADALRRAAGRGWFSAGNVTAGRARLA